MNFKQKIIWMIFLMVSGGILVVVLYLWSERIIHYDNTFSRRYPPHGAQEIKALNLEVNSFYFAGIGEGKIYLGNSTSPLLITVVDTSLLSKSNFNIELHEKHLKYRTPQIKISGNNFFVYEGLMPYVYKGKIENKIGKLQLNHGNRFSQLEIIDSIHLAVRFIHPKTGENILGRIHLLDTLKPILNTRVLEKQLDGIFDTDGYLLYDATVQRVVYLYRYRNQFIVLDNQLKIDYKGNTIDTISKAQIKTLTIKKNNITTYSEPPLIVNKTAAVSSGMLYVNSALPGKYEYNSLCKNASIIDVYDLIEKSYQSSFPIYNKNKDRMRSFVVVGDRLYALIGDQLVSYKLRKHLTKNKN